MKGEHKMSKEIKNDDFINEIDAFDYDIEREKRQYEEETGNISPEDKANIEAMDKLLGF